MFKFDAFEKIVMAVAACVCVAVGVTLGFTARPILTPSPTLNMPEEVKSSKRGLAKIPVTHTGEFRYSNPPELDVIVQGETLLVLTGGLPTGRYPIHAVAARGSKLTPFKTCWVIVGDPGPDPVPPDPTPPDPVPPAPIKGKRVLIVVESADTLPAAQTLALNSRTVHEYLNAHCDVDDTRKDWKAWRIWDKDDNTSNESKQWQEAFARPRKSVPWIQVYGRGSFEGPLPGDTAGLLALLKKHLE